MRHPLRPLILSSTIVALLVIELDSGAPPGSALVGEAEAIIGAPMTPVSYAGVARRTTRRVVAVEATEAAAVAAAPPPVVVVTAPPAPPPVVVAPPPPPPAPPAGAPALGTIVATLPPGCTPMEVRGVEYYYGGGVFYRAAFQGPNLVYVVTQP